MIFGPPILDQATIDLISAIIATINLLLFDTIITRWLARTKDWNDSFGTAFIVNLLWFIVDIIINLAFPGNLLLIIIGFIINLILGAIIVSALYKKDFGESFLFVIAVLIVKFIIVLILVIVLTALLALILLI